MKRIKKNISLMIKKHKIQIKIFFICNDRSNHKSMWETTFYGKNIVF